MGIGGWGGSRYLSTCGDDSHYMTQLTGSGGKGSCTGKSGQPVLVRAWKGGRGKPVEVLLTGGVRTELRRLWPS